MSDKVRLPLLLLAKTANWRLAEHPTTGDLLLQRYENGAWVTKETWS